MRLTCPNCDAHYDVDEALIPDEGRDVQCSNCTTTWFQPGPQAAEEPASDPEIEIDKDVEEDEFVGASATATLAAARGLTPRRPELSEADRSVIDEEVARETAARQEEAGALETQPDLGIDDTEAVERAEAARDRIARRRGDETETSELVDKNLEDDFEEDVAPAPQRPDSQTKSELLPDIEEINSTLEEAPQAPDEVEPTETLAEQAAKGKRGFRIGFGLALLVFAGLIFAYVEAASLAERAPQLAETLAQYQNSVDKLRISLESAAQSMVEQMNAMIGQISN